MWALHQRYFQAPAKSPSSWTVVNNDLKITLTGDTNGAISGFVDLNARRDSIADASRLYRSVIRGAWRSAGGNQLRFSELDGCSKRFSFWNCPNNTARHFITASECKQLPAEGWFHAESWLPSRHQMWW